LKQDCDQQEAPEEDDLDKEASDDDVLTNLDGGTGIAVGAGRYESAACVGG
jgi:hypothetical protein